MTDNHVDLIHVWPRSDSIGHTGGVDCVCGPDLEPILDDGHIYSWIVTHKPLTPGTETGS